MQLVLIILALLLLVGQGAVIYVLIRKKKDTPQDSFVLLQQQLQEFSRGVEDRIGKMSEQMRDSTHKQFSASQQLIQDTNKEMSRHLMEVTKSISETNESSKQVFALADQLKNLEKTLTHQKQRGALGEAALELVLANMLPPTAYSLQYQFKDGDVVDAIIKVKDGLISVDAKFSLDNYNRISATDDEEQKKELEKMFVQDLKKRIDETAKYIKPKEGTLPFAIMFIPAEGIYYDLLVNQIGAVKSNTRSLIEYAYKDKNVVIVSPTTFAAYLQSIVHGFRAFKIEESAKSIGKHVEALSRHLKAYDEYFGKVGKSLSTTVNHYNAATKEFKKIDKDVFKITGESQGFEGELLDRPVNEEI